MSMRNSGTGASAGSVALVKVDTAATVADLANPTDGLGALKAGIDAISTGTIEPRLMAGTPYYVDAAMANDDADGTTPAKAKKTINAAIGVGGAGVDTFIRFSHTCGAGGTGAIHWHAIWEPIGEGCLLAVA